MNCYGMGWGMKNMSHGQAWEYLFVVLNSVKGVQDKSTWPLFHKMNNDLMTM